MDKMWQALRESVILQGILTVGIWGVVLWLVVNGMEVPEILTNAGYTILGFWFGTKVQSAVNRAVRH